MVRLLEHWVVQIAILCDHQQPMNTYIAHSFRALPGRMLAMDRATRAEDIAWIEEASKALEQEPIKLEFLEEALVA